MTRHIAFAIALIGIGAFFNSPATAAMDALRCEDQAANCVGACPNPGSGTFQNRCMSHCTRQVSSCLIRAYDTTRRWYRPYATLGQRGIWTLQGPIP